MSLMRKLYYSAGEVADILGENVTLVRFWANTFPEFIRPQRNAKGNRMYSKDDIDMLKRIYFLVKECGMTLEGAAKRLQGETAKIDNTVKVLDSLRRIRSRLEEIRKGL